MVTKSMQLEIAPSPAPATGPAVPDPTQARPIVEKPGIVAPAEPSHPRAAPPKAAAPVAATADKEGTAIVTT